MRVIKKKKRLHLLYLKMKCVIVLFLNCTFTPVTDFFLLFFISFHVYKDVKKIIIIINYANAVPSLTFRNKLNGLDSCVSVPGVGWEKIKKKKEKKHDLDDCMDLQNI